MSYPDESPRRRFERGSHRAEDWDIEPREEPRRYESDRLYAAGHSPIPPVSPRSRRLVLPPIEDTDPRVAISQDVGQARREIVVRREQPYVLPPAPAGPDPLDDMRGRLYAVLQVLAVFAIFLVLLLIFILGSFIFHHVR